MTATANGTSAAAPLPDDIVWLLGGLVVVPGAESPGSEFRPAQFEEDVVAVPGGRVRERRAASDVAPGATCRLFVVPSGEARGHGWVEPKAAVDVSTISYYIV